MTEELKEAESLNISIDDLALDKNGKLTHIGWNNVVSELLKVNPLWIRKFNQQKDLSEKDKLTAIKENPMILAYIENPSEELEKTAVNINPAAFRFIKHPSEEVAREALFSKVSLKNNGNPIWDQVKKKFKKFSNRLASELADSEVYAERAYNDYGIYRNDVKTSRGFLGLGKEKQKGGELVNKNGLFSKLKRKVKGTPQSISNLSNRKALNSKNQDKTLAITSAQNESYDFWYNLLNESTKDYFNK